MSEQQSALCNALKDVDRIKRNQRIAFGALLFALCACLVKVGYLAGNPATDIRQMLAFAVITMVVTVVYGAVAVAMFVNKCTTRKILTVLQVLSEVHRSGR